MGDRKGDGARKGVLERLGVSVSNLQRRLSTDLVCSSRYERIDELVWVKTNQLQGLIRTGSYLPLLSALPRTDPTLSQDEPATG